MTKGFGREIEFTLLFNCEMIKILNYNKLNKFTNV